MSVKNENAAAGASVVLERPAAGGVYASLFEKINLNPVSELSALDIWQDAQAMSDATADERLTAGMQVFLECLTKSGSKVEKLDKNLIDHHIAELDYQISRQLDAVMHSEEFQAVESLWRGVKSLVDKTDFRQNVKVELLDMSKEDLRQDFEDSPEIIQSGLYKHTYIDEYDTPGGEPIAALISAYEFDASAQDVALLRNIPKMSRMKPVPNSMRFIVRWKVVCRKREVWMRWYRRMPVPAKPLRLPVTAMPRPSGGSRPVRICWLRPVPLSGQTRPPLRKPLQ